MSSETGLKQPPAKRNSAGKVVLDTITTRFLMLFIIVLLIPLVSMIFFTRTLLTSQLEYTATSEMQHSLGEINARLNEKSSHMNILLDRFSRKQKPSRNEFFSGICPSGSSAVCLWADFDKQMISANTMQIQSFANFSAQFKNISPALRNERLSRNYYGLLGQRLYLFSQVQFTPEVTMIYGEPIDDLMLKGIYKENPLSAFTWIIKTPAYPNAPIWLASSHPDTTKPSADMIKQALTTSQTNWSRFRKNSEDYKIASMNIYSPSQQLIAMIITALPMKGQDEVLAQYYQGGYIIMVVGLFFSVFIAIFAARTITRPLYSLINQVERLSKSQTLSDRISVEGVYEIVELEASFNTLLERLDKEHVRKDEFVATLTHDLKVPLLAEKQTLDYMEKQVYGPLSEAQQEVVGALKSSNKSTLGLVNGLLEVYRYDSGQTSLVFEPVLLLPVLQDVINQVTPLAAEKNISLSLDIRACNPEAAIRADAMEIKRVFLNLFNNAIANTPKYGSIRCTVDDQASWGSDVVDRVSTFEHSSSPDPLMIKDHILVSVQDTGVGFETDDLPNLFRRFAANRGRNPMSIGLGLYNCYQVIQAHHGNIWVETTEGEGSAVNLLLPVIETTSRRNVS